MFQCFVKDISYTRQGKIEKVTQLEWTLQIHSCYVSKPKTSELDIIQAWSLYESQ